MRVAARWLSYILGIVVLLALLAAAWVWFASRRVLAEAVPIQPERLVPATPAALADAQRRARTLGCVSCHGEDLAGKPFLDDAKIARIHATNLTEVASRASDEQLAQAIRQGVSADGRALLVMPSEAYQFLTDEETAALVALIRSKPRRGGPSPRPSVGPLGRIGLVNGKFETAPALVAAYRGRPPVDLGAGHALGRHLARTTCAGCHGSDLGGRAVSPDNVAPDLAIAGAYDLAAFTRLLREGAAPPGRDIRVMKRIAAEDSRFYTDREIAALHAYLVARAQR